MFLVRPDAYNHNAHTHGNSSVVLTSSLLRFPLIFLHFLLLCFRGGPGVLCGYQERILYVLHTAAGTGSCGKVLAIGCLHPLKPGTRLGLLYRTLTATGAWRRCGKLFRWLQFFKLCEGNQYSDSWYNWNGYLQRFYQGLTRVTDKNGNLLVQHSMDKSKDKLAIIIPQMYNCIKVRIISHETK